MAIGTPNAGTATTSTAAGTSSVPFPTTTSAGSTLTLGIMLFGANSPCTTPTGWTLAGSQGGTGFTLLPTLYVFYKIADGTEGGTSLTVTHASFTNEAQIVEWPGVDQITPLDVTVVPTDDSVAGTTTVLNTITPVTTGCTAVYWAATNGGVGQTGTQPGGWTELCDSAGTTVTLESAYIANQSASAVGGTITWSATGKQVAILAALRPAPDLTPSRQPLILAPADRTGFAQKDLRNANLVATAANPLVTPLDTAWQSGARYWHLFDDAGNSASRSWSDYQRDRRNANLVATAANPLVTPLDSAWQADARYWHLYDDAKGFSPAGQQRAYISPPSLLATAQLENELLGGADTARHSPAAYTDRRLVPQQPKRDGYTPGLLDDALLENELLGSAADQHEAWYADRRQTVPQPLRLANPTLIASAQLENELLGGADTRRHYFVAAWFTDRRVVPQQRTYYLPATPFELENELLGGGDTARHLAWFTDRRLVPTQRNYVSNPSLLLTALLESPLLRPPLPQQPRIPDPLGQQRTAYVSFGGGSVSPDAELTTVTITAFDANGALLMHAVGRADITVTANDATANASPGAELTTVTLTAFDGTVSISQSVAAELTTVTASGFDATVVAISTTAATSRGAVTANKSSTDTVTGARSGSTVTKH